MAEFSELNYGDKVYVNPYRTMSMRYQGATEPGRGSGLTGYVDGFRKRYHWTDSWCDVAILIPFHPETATRFTKDSIVMVDSSHLTILEHGTRRIIPGIDIPMSPGLWFDVEVEKFKYRLRQIDYSHQGFSNLPTFLAWLYLTNDRTALSEVRSQRRKDGTINPKKVRDIFYWHKLEVDKDAFELPVDIPKHLEGLSLSGYYPTINWPEVAANV